MNSPHTPPSFCHVAQQVRRDKLRFDQPIFDLSSSFDPFTLPSNLELLPYNNSSNSPLSHSPLSQMLPPSLTLDPNNTTTMITMGPLGPFTGYAIIVRGSRFLKPAQMLLEEFCVAVMGDDKGERERLVREDFDGVSGSSLSSSNEKGNVCKLEFEEKKAKLLYMQEEVSRRYEQYQQQMQMVVSSFESVPGLSSATPYTSQALKSVSRHFRRLKNVISNQLKQLSRMLGEESTSSPCRGVMAGKSNTRLPYMEHNHPVWRPQRGLPEKAVSVLRAWLFDHFLHPYPTDTDKHMLASQTGLSRNQVSNWFINARVRLWKPMVEEIHMLETKGKNTNSTNKLDSKNGAIEPTNTIFEHNNNNSPLLDVGFIEPALREKSTDQCMDAMEENMISFGGFTEAKIDHLGAGFGPVSLTLGLRHDSVYQHYQQQQQHQQQQLRHFGGQMLHDFVG